MDKKTLIEEIAKRHHIILDENDPIFAVVSANEMIFDELLLKAEKVFARHRADLEGYRVGVIKELKEHSANTQEALKSLQRSEVSLNSSQVVKKEAGTPKTELKKYLFWMVAGQVVFLLIGLIIGTII
jgi:hypothetical protein